MTKKILTALVLTVLATSPAWADNFLCPITEVAVWPDRVHIQCASSPSHTSASTVIYFAVPTTGTSEESAKANRFLQVALAALKSPDAPLWVSYGPTDSSGASFGCVYANCRTATAIFLQKE